MQFVSAALRPQERPLHATGLEVAEAQMQLSDARASRRSCHTSRA